MKTYWLDPDAEEDLDDIWRYMAKNSKTAASKFINEFRDTFDTIANNPDMGRRYSERDPGLQVFVSGKYYIFYRVVKEEAQIKRVLHGARDLSRIVFE